MAGIKNIVFDFGGVLFNINYRLTQDAFAALGFKNVEQLYGQYAADEIFDDLEKGLLTDADFYDLLKKKAGNNILEADIRGAWNKMLLDFRWESLAYLKTIKEKYRLFLLSNTNIIHYTAFIEMFNSQQTDQALEDYFEKAWFSHQINQRKPDTAIFQFILQDAGLNPEETLFIDDTLPNIEAAKSIGIHTHLLLPNQLIESIGLESWQ